MKSFESICSELIKQPNFWLRMAIGVVLAAIPFVNILAFGYIYRAIRENGNGDDFLLPGFDFSIRNLRDNLLIGVHGIALLLVFLAIPVLAGYLAGLCLFWIGDSMKLLLAYCGLLIGAPAAACSMLLIENIGVLSIRVVWSVFAAVFGTYRRLFVPSFLFLCLMILGVQLLPMAMIGVPIFFGLIFMVAFVRNLKIIHG
jgi:hypothetical protein